MAATSTTSLLAATPPVDRPPSGVASTIVAVAVAIAAVAAAAAAAACLVLLACSLVDVAMSFGAH